MGQPVQLFPMSLGFAWNNRHPPPEISPEKPSKFRCQSAQRRKSAPSPVSLLARRNPAKVEEGCPRSVYREGDFRHDAGHRTHAMAHFDDAKNTNRGEFRPAGPRLHRCRSHRKRRGAGDGQVLCSGISWLLGGLHRARARRPEASCISQCGAESSREPPLFFRSRVRKSRCESSDRRTMLWIRAASSYGMEEEHGGCESESHTRTHSRGCGPGAVCKL